MRIGPALTTQRGGGADTSSVGAEPTRGQGPRRETNEDSGPVQKPTPHVAIHPNPMYHPRMIPTRTSYRLQWTAALCVAFSCAAEDPTPDSSSPEDSSPQFNATRPLPTDVLRQYIITHLRIDPFVTQDAGASANSVATLPSTDAWDDIAFSSWFDLLDAIVEPLTSDEAAPPRLVIDVGEMLPGAGWMDVGDAHSPSQRVVVDNGPFIVDVFIPESGEWRLQLNGSRAFGPQSATVLLSVDGGPTIPITLPSSATTNSLTPIDLHLDAGNRRLRFQQETSQTPALAHQAGLEMREDEPELTPTFALATSNVAHAITIGTLQLWGPPISPIHHRCSGTAPCPDEVISRIAEDAWRLPPSHPEVVRLRELATDEEGLAAALLALYTSPRFLTLANDHSDSHSVANRLAELFWRGPPDKTLRACAADPDCDWSERIERLLDDPRAESWIRSFLTSWIGVDLLTRKPRPHAVLLPQGEAVRLHDALIQAFQENLRTARPLQSLLHPDEESTLLAPAMVALMDSGTPPHPTRRGAWVLRHLLCEPVGSPPATFDVPDDADRDELEAVTASPTCRACHDLTDPIGYALSDRDSAGRPIEGSDSRGGVPGGPDVEGAEALARALSEDPRTTRCIARHLIAHADGSLPHLPADDAQVTELVSALEDTGFRGAAHWLAQRILNLGIPQ